MPGVWKKTMQYLGLVEEDELEDLEEAMEHHPSSRHVEAEPTRRAYRRPESVVEPADAIVRTIPSARAQATASIHRAEPHRFNDARDIGERFRHGVPVIVNLQSTDDTIARRLVDFCSGLVFGLDGKIEQVASRVYLLTPANMDVSAEERERIVEGGFYNQF